MADIRELDSVREFYGYTESSLERNELGIKGFADTANKLLQIKSMIEEMITVIDSNATIPLGLAEQVFTYINRFNEHAELIKRYDIDTDANSNFNKRTNLISQINAWITLMYTGFEPSSNANGFMVVYNALKMYNLMSLQKDKTEIEELKANFKSSNDKAVELVHLLQTQATSVTIHDYAAIFKDQALKHSQFKFNWFKSKIGLAQTWLVVAIILIVSFGYFIKHEGDFLPFDTTNPNVTVITLQLLTRILVISFFIYIVTFAFKQFNVQNHLHTVNQHRQNTLNSYKLFIESLDSNDSATKNALMMEVAKSIYESGPSGYLSNKDSDSSPSIIEMTKFVGQSK